MSQFSGSELTDRRERLGSKDPAIPRQVHVVIISPVLLNRPMAIYSSNHTLRKEEYPTIIKTIGHRYKLTLMPKNLSVIKATH